MDILIDTTPLKTASGIRGIGRYVFELVAALRKLNTEHHFYTTDNRPAVFDIIHYPFFDLFFPTLPIFKKKPTIVTIHDVIPLVFPKHHPVGIRGRLSFIRQSLALKSVSWIITDSHASKRDIVEKLKIDPEKVAVVPLGASENFHKRAQSQVDETRKKYDVPKNYVLYVGDINYNKNLPFLISVMGRIQNVSLVLVGKAVNNAAIPEGQAIQRAITEAKNHKFVKLLDKVDSQEDLARLYSGAKAYVQPSLYEGFGLPVIEAMRCKVPVVSSLGGSLPEIVGEMGFLFHPRDPHECENAIRKALRLSPTARAELVKKAYDYSMQFNWERTARETIVVYEKVGR